MKSEEARQSLPATVTDYAPRVAAVAAGNNRDGDQGRAAYGRLHAHLQRRHGRLHFDNSRRRIAA